MSFLDLIGTPTPRPRRVLLYGTHGIGKSTWAASAPKPVFIQTEDGLRDIRGVKSFPISKDIFQVFEQIDELLTKEHPFETLAIDSVDWAEQHIQRYVFEKAGKDCITEVGGGFGRGENQAATIFQTLLEKLGQLNNERGMMIIMLAHCKVDRYESPHSESYDRYTPKVDKRISGLLQEWCDEVFFANYKVYVRKEETGFGNERGIGMGSGERVIYTSEMPSHLAKNRLTDCPKELPLSFAEYWRIVEQHYAQDNPVPA